MAKYGLFSGSAQSPMQEYEGDNMSQDGEYVKIWVERQDGSSEQVAAVRLDRGQSLRKM